MVAYCFALPTISIILAQTIVFRATLITTPT